MFECIVMSWMSSVSKPICFTLTIIDVQTLNREFDQPVQMKESNHLKTHKRSVCPLGHSMEIDLYSMVVIHTESMHVCIDLDRAHSICPSWEI